MSMKSTNALFTKSMPSTSPNLPDRAMEFLRLIDTSRQPNTKKSYWYSLRQFFSFLSREKITEEELKRPHIEVWLKELKARNLSPTTRCIRLLVARAYLRWLRDTIELTLDADKLIRDADFPKIPRRLPRPLAPSLDAEIQKRLAHSLCPHHHALLLMRKTGIRIGELSMLSFDCVYIDTNRRAFLKVPLGKLHNERLVPLDDKALELIQRIQSATKKIAQQPNPPFLIRCIRRHQRDTLSVQMLRVRFDQVVRDLRQCQKEPLTPHQFRHSYASELLNAGMSLESVMQLLGHRSIESTLKYAAVTQRNILQEYHAAQKKLQNNYGTLTERLFDFEKPASISTNQLLTVTMTALKSKKIGLSQSSAHKMDRILTRLRKIKSEVNDLLRHVAPVTNMDKHRYKKAS